MNQITLKSALAHTQILVLSAKKVQKDTFERLAPDCEDRQVFPEHLDNPPECRKRKEAGNVRVFCCLTLCPHVKESVHHG